MKDIDFDELDKAVSSLLGEREDQSSDETKPAVASETPISQEDADIPELESSTTSSQPNLVEKRSKGRFMDVVHPSSDMKNLQKPSVPRTAVDLIPPTESTGQSDTSTPEELDLPDDLVRDAPTVTEHTSEPSLDEPAVLDEDSRHNLPDPLDFHGFSHEEDTTEQSTVAEEALVPETDSADDTAAVQSTDELEQTMSELAGIDALLSSDVQEAPLETPFVTATDSLEKRPLGAFSASNDNTEDDSVEQKPALADSVSSSELDKESSSSTSEELQADGVRDETTVDTVDQQHESGVSESAATQADSPSASTDEPELQTVVEPDTTPEELRQELVSIEAAEVTTAAPVTTLAEVGSIPQQYTTKQQPQHTESTAIFDTDQYHQPLKHAPKKKSGIGTVVLIIALILVGAGGGAAFYFLDPLHLFS